MAARQRRLKPVAMRRGSKSFNKTTALFERLARPALPRQPKQYTSSSSRKLAPRDLHAIQVVQEEPLGEVLAGVHRAGERHVPVLFVPQVRHVHKRARLASEKGASAGVGVGRRRRFVLCAVPRCGDIGGVGGSGSSARRKFSRISHLAAGERHAHYFVVSRAQDVVRGVRSPPRKYILQWEGLGAGA